MELPGLTIPGKADHDSRPLLRVEDLSVSFGSGKGPRVRAVDGVRMTAFPGQTLAVVGESGCGKSVTALSALRLVPSPPGRVDRGRIMWRQSDDSEIDLVGHPESRMRRIRGGEIAMIFQEPMTSLNPVYSIGDQLIEAIKLHRDVNAKKAQEIALQAMAEVGIPEPEKRIRAYPHQFSGGMRQRVMIAMALACQPRLLLADEPTTALDVTIQAQILELLAQIKHRRNMSIMLITHDLGVVAENADVVCVMYAGRVVEYAPALELFDQPLHPYTRGLLASIPRLGDRRDKLATIREIVDKPGAFDALPGSGEGLRPWWPWHKPPEDLRVNQTDYHLLPVSPTRWVGVWATRATRDLEITFPALPHVRRPAPVEV